jgi:hypothetical protein
MQQNTNVKHDNDSAVGDDELLESMPKLPIGKSYPTVDEAVAEFFPFDQPYPVQTALMETLLTSLGRLVNVNVNVNVNNSGGGGDGGGAIHIKGPPANSTPGRNTTINNNKYKSNANAKILLMESPTGTGKSLSLACASLAWLQYMQHWDVNNNAHKHEHETKESDDSSNTKNKQNNHNHTAAALLPSPTSVLPLPVEHDVEPQPQPPRESGGGGGDAFDWIDAWQPTPQAQPPAPPTAKPAKKDCTTKSAAGASCSSQMSKHYNKNNKTQDGGEDDADADPLQAAAKEHRAQLEATLLQIRKDIARHTNSSTGSTAKDKESTGMTPPTTMTTTARPRDRVARQHISKVLVAASKASQEEYMNHRRRRVRPKQDSKEDDTATSSSSSEDFCVEDYSSDNNNHKNGGKGGAGTSYSDSDSDSDGDGDRDNIELKTTGLSSKQQGKNSTRSKTRNNTDASHLLNGNALDGSSLGQQQQQQHHYAATTSSAGPKPKTKFGRYNNHNKPGSSSTASTSTSIPAAGNVQAGTGVRKIIYAARTHSQLSQFVGELRRVIQVQASEKRGADADGASPPSTQISHSQTSQIKVITLGGRAMLCGNDAVVGGKGGTGSKKKSESMVTEACLDLQKNKKSPSTTKVAADSGNGQVQLNHNNHPSRNNNTNNNTKKRKSTPSATKKSTTAAAGGGGCPLLRSASVTEAVPTLALHMLAQPSDIEDMASLGKATHTCAYYAARVSDILSLLYYYGRTVFILLLGVLLSLHTYYLSLHLSEIILYCKAKAIKLTQHPFIVVRSPMTFTQQHTNTHLTTYIHTLT